MSGPSSHLIPSLVSIPAGRFLMGLPDGVGQYNEGPQHAVELTRPYAIGVTPVTQAQWKSVVDAAKASPWAGEVAGLSDLNPAPSHFSTGPLATTLPKDRTTLPVDQVSWLDVILWCNALSRLSGRRPAYYRTGDEVTWDHEADGFRLPTEAEWEHAARAGTDTPWWCGAEAELREVAWYHRNSGGTSHPVAQKRANPWGLHDVHGNVWEWCWDWYDSSFYASSPPVDPVGPPGGDYRISRGGNFGCTAAGCDSAHRSWVAPDNWEWALSFRLVLSPP